jgi:hypothetical protein
MVARVDEIFKESNYVQVSIAYFTKSDVKDDETDNIQKLLMQQFNDNKVLISQIKSVCYKNKIDFKDFWYKIIHPLDNLRRNIDFNISLLEYFNENNDIVIKYIKDNYNDDNIIENINNLNDSKQQKLISKIGIISVNGIDHTINIIKKVVDINNDWVYNFKYETAPYYILESNSVSSSVQNHDIFINMLKDEAKTYESQIFIKVEYVGSTHASLRT